MALEDMDRSILGAVYGRDEIISPHEMPACCGVLTGFEFIPNEPVKRFGPANVISYSMALAL
jgi:hypothetical protein